ncbi:MAG: flavin monoamine oxidase family protein, partial [Pseudonocardia sp.]
RYVGDARAWFPMPFDLTAVDTSEIERETLADRMKALELSAYDRDVLDGMLSTLVHSYDEQGIAQLLLWTATYFGHWDAFFETAGSWPIEGGTRRLLDAILGESTAELRLSTPVASIDDDGSGVVVTTRAGERVRARSAVVAVPLNALSDVTLTPDVVPPVRTMIDDRHPMRTVKVWARVRGEIEPFMAFAPVGANPINTARVEYHHDGDSIVVCFGSDSSALDGRDPEAVQRALRTFVADIEVLDTASHDWVGDPYARGTWVHHRPGNLTGAAPLMRAPHGRIHFAGGDIAPIVLGGIEGALETGTAAARSVAARLADGTY